MPPMDLLRTPVCYTDHSGRWPMLPSCSSQAQHVDMLGGKRTCGSAALHLQKQSVAVVRNCACVRLEAMGELGGKH
jgi:hypothetical protein